MTEATDFNSLKLNHILHRGSQLGRLCPPTGQCLEILEGGTKQVPGERATGIEVAEGKDVAEHPTGHRVVPTAKNYPAQMSICPG